MSEAVTQYGFELLKEIQARFPEGLTLDERDVYENLYLQSLGENPGNNWLSKMGWATHHRNAFRELLEQNGVQVLANPPVKVHAFDLEEGGLKRLSELQGKIRS